MKRPIIVFVFAHEGSKTSPRYGGFATRLMKAEKFPDADILTVALDNLVYQINESGASVTDSVTGFDLGEANFVYLKSWQSLPNEAAALGQYLFAKGVSFADTLVLGQGTSKLVTHFRHWAAGLRVPSTIYSRNRQAVLRMLKNTVFGDDTFILKDVEGTKGHSNYLVSYEEAEVILAQETTVDFMAQQFIPNDGDYRVGVYGGSPKFVLHRVSNGSSHLNNTSAGGRGELVSLHEVPEKMLRLAEQAAQASELQFAGIDVIQDKVEKKWYVLEANQGSQIVTGAYSDENTVLFNEGLQMFLRERIVRNRRKPRKTIGRRAIAVLPELGITHSVAKIDTGAYSSTLHAENLRIEGTGNGKELVFEVVPGAFIKTQSGGAETYRTRDYFTQRVRSSNGHVQDRYSIKTKIGIDGIRFMAVLTLSDRSEMGYPLLIGRKLLRSRFFVNVELNEHNDVEWKY